MIRKTGRGRRGEKETEEDQEWARETRNEVKIDSAGETSGSALCWFKQRTGCLVLYNHGEQSVITPPPVPISSRVLLDSSSPLLFLTISLSPIAPPFVLLFSLSPSSPLPSFIPHAYSAPSLLPSRFSAPPLFVVRARLINSTFLLSSSRSTPTVPTPR